MNNLDEWCYTKGRSNFISSTYHPAGLTCDFPFTYGGKKYWSCTRAEGESQAWCYTGGYNFNGKSWGYCDYGGGC